MRRVTREFFIETFSSQRSAGFFDISEDFTLNNEINWAEKGKED